MVSGKVAFAGTPEFAVSSLDALLREGYRVDPVLTQPDRPAGRGRRIVASPVKVRAEAAGLRVLTPKTVRDPNLAQQLGPAPDVMVVVAYGLLIPRWLLQWPQRGCVNVHASLLPRWRGASPIQHAILAGDSHSGVCIMAMEEGMDTGPVFTRRTVAIESGQTAAGLHDVLAVSGAEALTAALPGILAGSAVAEPQPDTGVTYAGKISKSDAIIDWQRPAVELERKVLAFNPWPVAETTLSGKRLRIWLAHAVDGGGEPGVIVNAGSAGLDVASGAGRLRITQLQLPGGKRLSAAEFLRGQSRLGGLRLGG